MFERDFSFVWSSLRRLGVPPSERDDLAQEVFVRVYQHLHEYDPRRPTRPWLFAFVFRCVADWRRLARHRLESVECFPEARAPAIGAEERLAIAQDRKLVDRALEHVPKNRRTVLVMHELEQRPMKDVARLLGIPLFTAYTRLRAARRDFASAVKRLL